MDVLTAVNITTAAGKIDAEYKNGELKIFIPKLEVKEPKKVKSISVN